MTTTSGAFDGRTVIITGGGSGIGRASAHAFADAGASVLVVGRTKEALDETADGRESIAAFPADVGDTDSGSEIVRAAVDRFGRVDVLVNNATTASPDNIRDPDVAAVRASLDVNVVGPMVLVGAAVPHLAATGGTIVNVSSIISRRSGGGAMTTYGAVKAALESLTRSWAIGLAADGIRVNAVAPGPTETSALEKMVGAETAAVIGAREAARTPLGRKGTPAEIATWILRLATPGEWVTGQVLDVDGGFTLPTYNPEPARP